MGYGGARGKCAERLVDNRETHAAILRGIWFLTSEGKRGCEEECICRSVDIRLLEALHLSDYVREAG
jgi:hypothetical protein